MRIIPLLFATTLCCTACDKNVPEPVNVTHNANVPVPAPTPEPARKRDVQSLRGPVTAIEVSYPNYSATLNRDGSGHFRFVANDDEPFAITPETFRQLETRLISYRQEATEGEPSTGEIIVSGCPRWLPYTEDAGHIAISWTGADFEDSYFNILGCDAERNRDRNAALLEILKMVPAPKRQEPKSR